MALTLAVAQPFCVGREVAANVLAHAEAVRTAAARVVLFPELSLTGYELESPALALDDPRLAPLIAACAEMRTLALAGAPVRGEAGKYLGLLAVQADGVRVAYRKMHLGGAEPDHFLPGPEPAVIEVDGWRLGLAICKDTGVPEHAAATAALGIDLYAAAVLEHEEDAHIPEERARRIAQEHGVWVAVASFAGATGGGYTRAAGRSGIWGPDGRVVSRAGSGVAAIVKAKLGCD